jgi:hypothetical protein
VRTTVDAPDLTWVLQELQLGTGHAVAGPAASGDAGWCSMACAADSGRHVAVGSRGA